MASDPPVSSPQDLQQRVYARFSNGTSASAVDSEAVLGLSGISIHPRDAAPLLWPYETLSVGEPLRAQAIDCLISSTAMPGATLFVPSPAFAHELASRAPHLTARAQRWRHTRPWLAIAAALAAIIMTASVVGWSPVRTMADMLPQSWRDRLGNQTIASMTEGQQRCVAPLARAALDRLAHRLTDADRTATPVRIVVSDWSLTNAFAVPGGQIVLTRALIEQANSADELAGVIAHEMGHAIELHPETSIIRGIGLAAAVEVMMGGTGGALANVGVMLAQLGYSRAAESEADQHALALLRTAKISPKGLGDFFERMGREDDKQKETDKPSSVSDTVTDFSILSSHPATAERLKAVRNQAPYPVTPALTPADWQTLKSICSVKAKQAEVE